MARGWYPHNKEERGGRKRLFKDERERKGTFRRESTKTTKDEGRKRAKLSLSQS